MSKKITLIDLSDSPLTQIISFLTIREVYINLSKSCKTLNKTITSSPYILRLLFENHIGRDLSNISTISNEQLKDKIIEYFLNNKNPINLPYFGFRGNCGTDEDHPHYLFDKVFEVRDSQDTVCTRIGENFEIEGMLSPDYDRILKERESIMHFIHKFNSPFKRLFRQIVTLIIMIINVWLGVFRVAPIKTNIFRDENILRKIEIMKARNERLFTYIRNLSNKYVIELPCEEMQGAMALFESCSIYRANYGCSCPVKTLMIFASMKEKIGLNNPMVTLFDNCKEAYDLKKILKKNKKKLPELYETSSVELCSMAKEFVVSEADVDYAVFSAGDRKEDVIPLLWVSFKTADVRVLDICLKKMRLSGRYVLLKLIDCENLMSLVGDDHVETNIDIGYCGLKGRIF